MTEDNLKALVEKVVQELSIRQTGDPACSIEEGSVPDLSAVDLRNELATPNPANAEEFLRIKATSAARLGVWRAGPRYRTKTLLRFRADHAVAMDAVFTDVSEDLLKRNGLLCVSTLCSSKDDFLTRPDLGRKFAPETIALLKSKCKMNPQAQIFVSDGLSSTAVEANLENILPSILQGLESLGIKSGTPFFVKYGRVGVMDEISQALGAEVTVVLLGERPGLATGESLSAYMTYKGYPGMPEAGRTVVSNIHKGGTNAVEAGAHIASMISEMLKQKASGLDLKL
ncbi:ethanolamine ammonia-lyase subunit EutC [Oscillospiraceae bacterium PP1C4]